MVTLVPSVDKYFLSIFLLIRFDCLPADCFYILHVGGYPGLTCPVLIHKTFGEGLRYLADFLATSDDKSVSLGRWEFVIFRYHVKCPVWNT